LKENFPTKEKLTDRLKFTGQAISLLLRRHGLRRVGGDVESFFSSGRGGQTALRVGMCSTSQMMYAEQQQAAAESLSSVEHVECNEASNERLLTSLGN